MSLPSEQLAVTTSKDRSVLKKFPVPRPGPGEVLIKNVAVASNPKDWKMPQHKPGYDCVEGNDVAGIIVDVGEGVSEYRRGERVAAFTKMVTGDPKYGAYAQYTVSPVSTTIPLPSTISFEEAATFPLAFMTAALGLFIQLGLPEPPAGPAAAPDNSRNLAVIVNGAASSVGAFAVQLAKRAGLFVIGVAGDSCDYAKSLGADVVIDYRQYRGDEAGLEKALITAVEQHNVPCSAALDAVSTGGSPLLLARVLSVVSPNKTGKVTTVLPVSDEDKSKAPQGVEIKLTYVASAYGEDEKFASRVYRQLGLWLVKSDANPNPIKANRVKIMPGGLEGVSEGLRLLKEGKVHGEKLVYRIEDTPGVKAE